MHDLIVAVGFFAMVLSPCVVASLAGRTESQA